MTPLLSKLRAERFRRASPLRRGPVAVPWFVVAAVALLWTSAFLMLLGLKPDTHPLLVPGQRAPATIVAAVDFHCPDLMATEVRRRAAADAQPPVFGIRAGVTEEANRTLEKMFDRVAQIRAEAVRTSTAPSAAALGDVLDLLGLRITPAEALKMVPETRAKETLASVEQCLAGIALGGIVSAAERESGFRGLTRDGRITVEIGGRPARIVAVSELPTPAEAADRAVDALRGLPAWSALSPEMLRSFVSPWLVPNLDHDPAETDRRRAEAASRVEAESILVRAGSVILEAGSTATAQTAEMLRVHQERRKASLGLAEVMWNRVGRGGLLAVGLLICLGLLHVMHPDLWRRRSLWALWLLLSVASLGAARFVIALANHGWVPAAMVDYLMPLALAPLIATILAGARYGMIVGLWTSLSAAVLAVNGLHAFFLGAAASSVAALAARHAARRSVVFAAGAWIGVVKAAYVLFAGAIEDAPAALMAAQAAGAFGGSMVAAIVALLILPLLESAFGLTSDIRLLELSDASHPLQQRLATEAPGTYHHSLLVANLAQAAAQEIGANALLARVCSLYHDIGKVTMPRYFIENLPHGQNPHDELPPNMSAMVIMSHVKEGLTLARLHRLPPRICDAIAQHHGTSLVSYFYHRAARAVANGIGRSADAPAMEETDFRYPGPRPDSREIAIVSLADAVEAASRSAGRPSPGRIRSLVGEIVARRMADGQLDDSPLTLAEIERIRTSFVFTLTGMMHGRVDYPDHEHRSEPADEPEDREPGPRGGADGVADDTRAVLERAEGMG